MTSRTLRSRVAPAHVVGGLLLAVATLQAGEVSQGVRVGAVLPTLTGRFLTGSRAVLPEAANGSAAVLLLGFTYASRTPVDAWAQWCRSSAVQADHVACYEVPMIGGMASMGRWFIEGGMRRGTPKELHDHVITVYGGTGSWKTWLSFSAASKDDAYVILLDKGGVVRWLGHGRFEPTQAEHVGRLLTELREAPLTESKGRPPTP